MAKLERSELDGFFVELKKLKNASELKEMADKNLRNLTPMLAQLGENLETRQKILNYPNALRKSRPIFKKYEDEMTSANDILIQIRDVISEYIKRDSDYKKAFQELYEKFDNGEYKTD